MNQILNELIGIPDITNIIEEYINGDRLYWISQYNCIIRDINCGCVPCMIEKESFVQFYDDTTIKAGYILQYESVMNEFESTLESSFRHYGYPTGILRWYRSNK